MGKIHVLMTKEEILPEKMSGKIAVVLDVLLATTTITSVLQHGAAEVIPVLDGEEAKETAARLSDKPYVLIGEYEGRTIEGFLDPGPSSLKQHVKGKTAILSTTNGTVAIRKSAMAAAVYAGCLLNVTAAARHLLTVHSEETILLICSGSSGQFCLEDFYGAGCFVSELMKEASWEVTDAAAAACLLYESRRDQGLDLLARSRVGRMLEKYGFKDEIAYAGQTGLYPVFPVMENGSMRGRE
ncbi:2-phosphosulfolactate phosphatase [Bacillus mangrovi]|uniref:Probable 2-phosphosulfolactate phosphatase n=1 Tax=Metabacillus mangrovi TaxID=1491830 RepID=A0A7X2V5Z6_9BACI|nr:2-phosphosulfolactate phosphatase [Metabacillus mangrovi]MTH55332.1 2-phosphosulfolactate phosphatase [Metabacillus mangrovi]